MRWKFGYSALIRTLWIWDEPEKNEEQKELSEQVFTVLLWKIFLNSYLLGNKNCFTMHYAGILDPTHVNSFRGGLK